MTRTGRPREFDVEMARDEAMHVFWEHGYDSTSLSQLKAAMGGISAASFYAAFGSKEALFREVVDRYLRTHGQVTAALQDAVLPPRAAVEGVLRASARMQTDSAHPSGCFIVLSAAVCSPESRHIQALLAGERQRTREALRACVGRAVEQGELRADTDVKALAAVFDTFLVGLATQARDGVPLDVLDAGISAVMAAWDTHAAQLPSRRRRAG